MGVLSNKDIERETYDREQPNSNKRLPKYNKEYEEFRKKYRTSRRPIEPKGYDDEKDVESDELTR